LNPPLRFRRNRANPGDRPDRAPGSNSHLSRQLHRCGLDLNTCRPEICWPRGGSWNALPVLRQPQRIYRSHRTQVAACSLPLSEAPRAGVQSAVTGQLLLESDPVRHLPGLWLKPLSAHWLDFDLEESPSLVLDLRSEMAASSPPDPRPALVVGASVAPRALPTVSSCGGACRGQGRCTLRQQTHSMLASQATRRGWPQSCDCIGDSLCRPAAQQTASPLLLAPQKAPSAELPRRRISDKPAQDRPYLDSDFCASIRQGGPLAVFSACSTGKKGRLEYGMATCGYVQRSAFRCRRHRWQIDSGSAVP